MRRKNTHKYSIQDLVPKKQNKLWSEWGSIIKHGDDGGRLGAEDTFIYVQKNKKKNYWFCFFFFLFEIHFSQSFLAEAQHDAANERTNVSLASAILI